MGEKIERHELSLVSYETREGQQRCVEILLFPRPGERQAGLFRASSQFRHHLPHFQTLRPHPRILCR